MKNLGKYIIFILWGILLCTNMVFAAGEGRQVVFVSGSTYPQLTPKELRRLYLGATVTKLEIKLVPLRNESDNLLYEMFLQKIVAMSASRYERFLINRVYRGAGSRPQVINEPSELIKQLNRHTGTVSFMWKDEAIKHDDINIIQPLW